MTPPEFSVLLLAWDDADPNVAVLGGAALPPTLPLVYQLAAQQPVLAVYPHLPPAGAAPARPVAEMGPAPIAPAPETPAIVAATVEPNAVPDAISALETAVPMTGVRLLPGLSASEATSLLPWSRLVGLDELELASPTPAALVGPAQALNLSSPAANRSQWPTGVNAPLTANWLAPAAPYMGASATESALAGPSLPPPAPALTPTPSVALLPTAKSLPAPLAPATRPSLHFLHSNGRPHTGDLHFDPDPELPHVRHPEAFDEPTEEIGPAEAGDISAPEEDLLPDAPLLPVLEAAPAPAAISVAAPVPAAPVALVPAPESLNFRMIQYARRAAQLVRGRSDFGVIYAPNWPAWLAALEIRNSSRRPLVLYAASLATDLADPAEHGYQLELERMTMRRATLILVPDEGVRRRLQILYKDAIGKVRVVPASDETTVQQLLAELAVAAG